MNKLWMILFLSISLLIGCSSQASLEPVSIDPDVDNCAECNMGIIETEHATQVIFKDGTPNIYDDIGCMLIDLKEIGENLGIGYVHDYNSKEWIDIEEATFVQESNIPTPMSYGLVAFHSSDDAEAFQAEHGGDIYSLDDLLKMEIQDFKHEDGHEHHDEGSDSHD